MIRANGRKIPCQMRRMDCDKMMCKLGEVKGRRCLPGSARMNGMMNGATMCGKMTGSMHGQKIGRRTGGTRIGTRLNGKATRMIATMTHGGQSRSPRRVVAVVEVAGRMIERPRRVKK